MSQDNCCNCGEPIISPWHWVQLKDGKKMLFHQGCQPSAVYGEDKKPTLVYPTSGIFISTYTAKMVGDFVIEVEDDHCKCYPVVEHIESGRKGWVVWAGRYMLILTKEILKHFALGPIKLNADQKVVKAMVEKTEDPTLKNFICAHPCGNCLFYAKFPLLTCQTCIWRVNTLHKLDAYIDKDRAPTFPVPGRHK